MKTARIIMAGLVLVVLTSWAGQALAVNYVNLIDHTEKWYTSEGSDKFTTLRLHTVVRHYAQNTYVMRRETLHNETVLSSEDLLFSPNAAGDILYYGKLDEELFSSPILWVDAPLAVGKTWISSRKELNGDPSQQVHYIFAVLDKGTVACPLGAFSCYEVFLTEVHADGQILNSTFWYNNACGMIMCTTETSRVFKLNKTFVGDGDDDGGYDRHREVNDGFGADPLGLSAAPNPSNPQTHINFALPEAAQVSVGVYDVSGRLVQSLADGQEMAAGPVSLRWQGRDSAGRAVASGTYLFRVQAGAIVRTERFTLVR